MHRFAAFASLCALLTSLFVVVGGSVGSPAGASPCGGDYVYKTRIVSRHKVDLSSVYSKRNSNRTESSTLSVSLESNVTDSSTVSAGYKAEINDIITKVEAHFDVSVTKTVSSSTSVTNEMKVMPLYYGRTKWQTIHTNFEYFRYQLRRSDCAHINRQTIWRASLITSRVHFAECQDKRNVCTPF